jgi:arginine decarboxylase
MNEIITTQSTMSSNPSSYVPKIIFFVKGKGIHKDQLTSFELALRDACIADLNLVSVSSIKQPRCKIVNKQEGRRASLPLP